MEETEFILKKASNSIISRHLLFNENFLKFENKNAVNTRIKTFSKHEITDYSFGVKWIRFYFVFGREYIINIKNSKNEVINIKIRSYFGRNKIKNFKLYSAVLDNLWTYYFNDLVTILLEKFNSNEDFEIGEVLVTNDGILLKTGTTLRQKRVFIPCDKVRTTDYATYFSIYAVDDAAKTNRGYSYLNDWNTAVIYSVLRTILKKKNFEN